MGCSCNGALIVSEFHINKVQRLKSEIKNSIEKSYFYNLSYSEFKSLFNQECESIDNILSIITSDRNKKNISKYELSILRDILAYATPRFENLLCSRNYLNEIMELLYFFINNYQMETFELKKDFFIKIINYTLNDKNEYNTGKLSFLILNICQLYLFSFVYFFVGINVLTIYFNKGAGINNFFLDKSNFKGNELNNLILEKLKEINKNINPKKITQFLLVEIFSNIEEVIYKNMDSENVTLSKDKIGKIAETMCNLLNAYDFVDTFFTVKTKII